MSTIDVSAKGRLQESSKTSTYTDLTKNMAELPWGHSMEKLPHLPGLEPQNPNLNKSYILGDSILNTAVMAVTLRSLPPNASGTEIDELHKTLTENFRYQECFSEVCGDRDFQVPNASSRDLLLNFLGHSRLRGETICSPSLDLILESYVDDTRRAPKEKYRFEERVYQSHETPPEIHNPENDLQASLPPVISDSQDNQASEDQQNHPQIVARERNGLRTISEYTVILGEYATKKGIQPSYSYKQTQPQPIRFNCRVTLRDREAVGIECSSMKAAKHEASRAMWNILTTTGKQL